MLFKGNQPPKRHQVQVRSVTGQRTLTARYVRLDRVRVVGVDESSSSLTLRSSADSALQLDAVTFDAEVASTMELVVSLEGLPARTRARLVRAGRDAVGDGPVSVLLDARRGRLG